MADLRFTDESASPKWRVFAGPHVPPGHAVRNKAGLVWSVSPGEWTTLGDEPEDAVDLTHARSMFRLTGPDAATLINRVCGLDLTDAMFPSGAAARTLFAGVATEIVRDDVDGTSSYLILPSSSFGTYITDVIRDAAVGFDLVTA